MNKAISNPLKAIIVTAMTAVFILVGGGVALAQTNTSVPTQPSTPSQPAQPERPSEPAKPSTPAEPAKPGLENDDKSNIANTVGMIVIGGIILAVIVAMIARASRNEDRLGGTRSRR